jgi:phage tail-like protein
MANPATDTLQPPFTAFNFAVEIDLSSAPGGSPKLCNASFSECDGLEMSLEIKTLREGGNNGVQFRLAGPSAFGMLTLKRGMTASFDLWNWFNQTLLTPTLRAETKVVLLAADGTTERAIFLLKRCIPIKLKAPSLNAKDGTVAIEEMQIAYESLELQPPGG